MSGVRREMTASTPLSVLLSGTIAVPGWFLLATAGLFTAVFLFMPWSTNAGQFIFMAASFVVGILFATLYWLSRKNSLLVPLRDEATVDQAILQDGGSVSLENLRNGGSPYQQQGRGHPRHVQLVSHGTVACCSSASSCWVWWHEALPAMELCILGLLVILSPHVMATNTGIAQNILSHDDGGVKVVNIYPMVNVWKVNFLHFWFVFAFNIPLAIGTAVGLIHFAALMAHFKSLDLGTIVASLPWLLISLICIPVVAVKQFRERFRRRWSTGLLSMSGDSPSSIPHAPGDRVYDASNRVEALPSSTHAVGKEGDGVGVLYGRGVPMSLSEQRPDLFLSIPTSRTQAPCGSHSIGNGAPFNELPRLDVMQHGTDIMAPSGDLRATYLLLSSSGGVIVGASESFAAHVGLTVRYLVGQKFISVLKELEVENVAALKETIQKVAFLHDDSVILGKDEEGREDRYSYSRIGVRRSLHTELGTNADAFIDSDGVEYSTTGGEQSPVRMGEDGTVRRILVRGRRPHRPSSTVAPSLSERKECPAKNGMGGAQKDLLPVERIPGEAEYFSLTLDVWKRRRDESTNSILVLCQPRLHCVLDWMPWPCLLVHPVTGCVLHWSREAERQTGRLAYDVVGLPAHASPIPNFSGLVSSRSNIKEAGAGEVKHEGRRGTRLDPPIPAILHIPSTPSLSLSVTFKPLTGDFVEDEGALLEGSVTGLARPLQRSPWKGERCNATDSRRALSCPLDARAFCRGSGKVEVAANTASLLSQCIPESSLKNCGDPTKERAGWYSAALASVQEGVSAWVFAGVPLLFVIHDEVGMPSDSATAGPCIKPQNDSMHAPGGVLPERRAELDEPPYSDPREILPAFSALEKETNDSDGTIAPLHAEDRKMGRQPHEAPSFPEGRETIHAVEKAEAEGERQNVCNSTMNIVGNNGDSPGVEATVADRFIKQPQFSTHTAVGLTPTTLSLQTSIYKSQRHSPLHNSMGKVNVTETDFSGARRASDGEHYDTHESSSRRRGQSDRDSRGHPPHTPLSSRGTKNLKAVMAPPLVSPPPQECPSSTNVNGVDAHGEIALSKARTELNHQKHPEQLSYPQQHSLHPQPPLTNFPPVSSAPESSVQSELIASTVSNVNAVGEETPIWAMLRSSDETTIPSCFIRVSPGEGFLFGRSSKCHATTSDGFVSSIQFKIVRQLHSEVLSMQPTNQQDVKKQSLYLNHLRNSTPTSPHSCHAPMGNWVVTLYDHSVNGTYVNVKKVSKGKHSVLRDHDLITFRLSSSRFFLGFQFLLTDERGVPLSETAAAALPMTHSSVNSSGIPRRGTLHRRNPTSSESGSLIAASSSQLGGVSQSNNGGGSGWRLATSTRSRSGRPGGTTTPHRETIEWKIGEEMLGKGGNAEVFLGINLTNGKLIAVKRVLLPTVAHDDPDHKDVLQQYRSLQEEIKVLSRAVHPNIVQYLGSSQNKKYFNILLEFVPGGSLRHLLDNFGALSPGVICSYLRQTLEGLRYLHQRNIVHSDVKAANILITDKGRVKLSDFGTAKLLNRQHSQSLDRAGRAEAANGNDATTYRLAGTLRWMAPELLRGSVGPTRASDMWSVGCALIEMLSTEAPWSEYEFESEEQIMNLLRYTVETPEVPECAELPELTAIAKRCLTIDPAVRPTCEELLQLVLEAEERCQELQLLSPTPRDVSPSAEANVVATDAVSGDASVRRNSKREGKRLPQHRDPQETTDVCAATN
ncbi:protein kinase, putative [Trypanosoma cruzi marinkellei]|uniref:Protein kinase, putative n=1 Tax=Trypanosoma cruzi marinkellei TaxID=85056 RepID=K2MVA2_TRYCR|nr:protein kinase, putative [Trypanosoma cruzi marinkellei]